MNSFDLVISNDNGKSNAGGYLINSKLMNSKNFSLIKYANSGSKLLAIPAGLSLLRDSTSKLISQKINKDVVSDSLYEQLLDKAQNLDYSKRSSSKKKTRKIFKKAQGKNKNKNKKSKKAKTQKNTKT